MWWIFLLYLSCVAFLLHHLAIAPRLDDAGRAPPPDTKPDEGAPAPQPVRSPLPASRDEAGAGSTIRA